MVVPRSEGQIVTFDNDFFVTFAVMARFLHLHLVFDLRNFTNIIVVVVWRLYNVIPHYFEVDV